MLYLLWITLAAAAAALGAAPPRGKRRLETACSGRRKPECSGECAWVVGDGCVDREPDRYFAPDGPDERRQKFCRCALHLMARGVAAPHAVCARSTRTSTGGKPCHYDFDRIPADEVRAYARSLVQSGRWTHLGSDEQLRRRLKRWYEAKKPRPSGRE